VILYGTNLSPQVITILQDVTSAVQANSTTQAHVYPSIFKNNVHVAQAEVGAKLSIFTMQGRQVLEQVVHTNNQSIPTQNLASGIYVVRLQQSSGIVTQRIVKE
ncbi:MAG: T9SS type A sorting domain-containing protein, partial [Paludibacter sp.]|nr:T9SS type A sorting domain-containing protein [Paludibacter sp.]